jgi:uncharacterized protein DUF4389
MATAAQPSPSPRRSARSPGDAVGAAAATEYPVAVEARIDEPLSRWLWLVKWILVIPHAIVLAFLWLAFAFAWVAALVAIVATGRYPRALFDFNLGVLRWTWRVWWYSSGGFGTDRYPPFTLGEADYPAELHVPYPEHLSRPKALLKWWLLAIPHYAVVVAFLWGLVLTSNAVAIGLLPILALIAGGFLLVTGRWPRELFPLVSGIDRWVLRVAVYVSLMRDEYPPFRLGR